MKKNDFSDRVYNLVKKIPKGRVSTYKIIAEKLGCKGYRAVGQALKNNKNPVVIPCHRIIKSDGFLGGYCGKLNNNKKKKLLKKEGVKITGNKIHQKLFYF